jgi:non-ribosomal peptide synthetase component F
VGGTVVSVPSHAYRAMTEFVTAEGITVWYSTPSAISVVALRGGLHPKSMPTPRLSTFADDALKAADAAAWQAAAPEAILDNLYGPAETTITCSAYRWSSESSPGDCLNGIVSIGRLHSGHDCLLLDENGDESATEGELCVSGPQVSPGYLNPEDGRERFFTRGSRRWYRTGDRVRLADSGDLLFLGRADNQVQIQGWRTELAEIDHYVRRCADVEDAVTVPVTIDGKQHADDRRGVRQAAPAGAAPADAPPALPAPARDATEYHPEDRPGRAAAACGAAIRHRPDGRDCGRGRDHGS